MPNTKLRNLPDRGVFSNPGRSWLAGRRSWSPGHGAERADQGVVGGEPVPSGLAGIPDVGQATKDRVGEPVAAPIVPHPLDGIELRAIWRQRQQGDIAGHHKSLASVPAGPIEDHPSMGIGGDLTADLAPMVVHGEGIADRHDQRRRLARRRANRAKHIGRGEAEILWRHRPAGGLPPHPGRAVLLADPGLVGEPQLDSRTACLRGPDSV